MPRMTDIARPTAIGLALLVSAPLAAYAKCWFHGVRGYTDSERPSPDNACQAIYLFDARSPDDRHTITFESEGRQYKAKLGGGGYYYIQSSDVSPPTKSDFAAVFQIDKEGMMTSGYCGDGFIALTLDRCE